MNHTYIITELAAGGDGVAIADGKKIFVPFAAIGDVVDDAGNIIEQSKARQKPACAHFGECGGCRLQHLSEADYLDFKNRIAVRAATHAGFADVAIKPAYFCQPASRRRAEFVLQRSGGKVRLAFQAASSHKKIAIDNCPVLCDEIQKIIPSLADAISAVPDAAELESIHLTSTASGIDAVLGCTKKPSAKTLSALAEMAKNVGLTRLSYSLPEGGVTIIAEFTAVKVAVAGHMVGLPPAAFLQASAEAQTVITDEVLDALAGRKNIADLFSGIGTYSIPLAAKGSTVTAYEGEQEMVAALSNARIPKINAVRRDLFTYPLNQEELKKFDGVVINPPRAGAKAQTQQLAKSANIKTIAMVSCNPFSFANDAKILRQSGFVMKSLLPVDQFVWSTHLELVAVFDRV